MTESGTRTPAWKRLGLTLRNSDESQPAVPETNGLDRISASVEQQVQHTAYGTITEARVNEKTTSLGKRKRDHGDNGDRKTRKTVHERRAEDTKELPLKSPPSNSVTRSPSKAPKGDPNYRKKKTHSLRPTAVRTPSLSPGEQGQPTLIASIEHEANTGKHMNGFHATPQPNKSALSVSPLPVDRRKSVTFTPDTKTSDGNSTATLFKKWVAEQKASGGQTSFSEAEIVQYTPPKTHPANNIPDPRPSGIGSEETKKTKQPNLKKTADPVDPEQTQSSSITTTPTQGKKKDPNVYLSYLSQYHAERNNWKFNKAKQNDVVDNALNVFRIPNTHEEALLEYIQGLKGAGVIQRLRQSCDSTLAELGDMDNQLDRDQSQQEALEARLTSERKRRRLESDIEGLENHPHPEAYIRRLKKRRAEALLKALNMAAPSENGLTGRSVSNQHNTDKAATASRVRKSAQEKKSRKAADVSSDDSTDSSSSSEEDESSSESDETSSESASDGGSSGSHSESEDTNSSDDNESSGGVSSDSD